MASQAAEDENHDSDAVMVKVPKQRVDFNSLLAELDLRLVFTEEYFLLLPSIIISIYFKILAQFADQDSKIVRALKEENQNVEGIDQVCEDLKEVFDH